MAYGVIILAAGSSSRLGKPKQLLPYGKNNLLLHALQTALQIEGAPVLLVLGSGAPEIQAGLPPSAVHIVENNEWKEGMASSIRIGITALLSMNPDIEGAILMVCDQPFVSTSLLKNLISTHQQSGKEVVACSYADTLGTPVLFSKSFFTELLHLEGEAGAKKIIKQHKESVATILFPQGNIDIDTPADYEALKDSFTQ